LREALDGHFRTEHHGLMIAQVLSHVDFLDESVAALSARVEQVIAPFSEQVALLCTIPGVARRTAEAIIAEIGVDMARFPTSAHLASWAGMCPGNHESAGKRKTPQVPQGRPLAAQDPDRSRKGRRPAGDQGCVPLRGVREGHGDPQRVAGL
jgi:transposase